MFRNLLTITLIILAATLAINNTIEKYNEKIFATILTPSQNSMRQPTRQNPGQNQLDSQTQRARNNETNRHWNNTPNTNSSKNDTFNRNKMRILNPLKTTN